MTPARLPSGAVALGLITWFAAQSLAWPGQVLAQVPQFEPFERRTSSALPAQPGGGAPAVSCQGLLNGGAQVAGTDQHAELEAHHKAIEHWRRLVDERFGQGFTHWWKARERAVRCRIEGGSTHCQATALPCASLLGRERLESSSF
jgi:hypothetical protein